MKAKYEYSNAYIKSCFRDARYLMREVERMMKDDTIADWSNDTDFGQAINELVGSVSMIYEWQRERVER
jgi:hypothetical protein